MANQKGFTLIELLVVMGVLVVLSGIALTSFSDEPDTASQAAAWGQVQQLSAAVITYHNQTGAYPVNLQALTVANGIYTPQITNLPTQDPYGTTNSGINGSTGGVSAYAYSYSVNGFAVWSLGKNKVNNSGGSGTLLPASIGSDDIGKRSK